MPIALNVSLIEGTARIREELKARLAHHQSKVSPK
jgi:hypothetical protein